MSTFRAIAILAVCCFVEPLVAQQTTVFTEATLAYKRGEEFFQKGAYGYAMTEYKNAINNLRPVNEPEWDLLRIKAELGYAKSAVRLDLPDGEKLILDFIRRYKPDPLAGQALLEVANYFYNARKYDKAIEFYKQISARELSPSQRAEVYFKTGYCYFVQKDFGSAEANFKEIKDTQGDYFYPTNYYYGLCKFFNNQYADAIKSFRLVERSKEYKSLVPYYIAQIYFAQRDYDELIKYAEPKLSDRTLRNAKEMNQLVGQAYFEKRDYQRALPFLEKFAESSGTMREEEFYQLAFCQYQVGKYQAAAQNFQQLNQVNSAMGQMALYYLGDCKLRLNDRTGARSAFAAAANMSYDPDIQESSLLNFAKLSYELKFEKDALSALQNLRPTSKYYNEAQSLMGEIFQNTRNFDQAISALERMPNKTPQLSEAYQKVLYLRGIQHYRDGRVANAKDLFTKSVSNAVSNEYKALALYWLGDIANQEKNYDKSIDNLNQFIALAKNIKTLPDESSIYTANYLQGYNYLKKGNFTTAQGYFQEAVAGIRRNRAFIQNKQVRDGVLGDATLRAGDCLFKRNLYKDAIVYYDEAVNAQYPGFEYALFQKAIIEGLRSNTADKILALESLIEKYPKSAYADDALFQLGATYLEIKQSSKASDSFQKLIASYPNSELVNKALLRLGLVAYNSGSLQTAINYYKQIFSHNPTKEESDAALLALQEIYLKDMGDPDGYNAFLETIPGFQLDNVQKDQNVFAAAESAYERGNYERAITSFSDYIRQYPNGLNTQKAYFHRGESYYVLEQYSLALKDYEWVIANGKDPDYYSALSKAAMIAYHNEQNFQQAYDLYTKWEANAKTNEDRFEAQLGAMRAAYHLGNSNAVQTSAQKVATNSAASDLQIATAYFYLGKIAYDRKDYDSAMQSFAKVVQLSDNEQTAEARYLMAYIHYVRRNLESAKQQCVTNNTENSGYPYWVGKSLILLADVYAEQGDLLSARTVLEALVNNYAIHDDDIIPTAQKKLEIYKKQASSSSRLDLGNDFMDDGD